MTEWVSFSRPVAPCEHTVWQTHCRNVLKMEKKYKPTCLCRPKLFVSCPFHDWTGFSSVSILHSPYWRYCVSLNPWVLLYFLPSGFFPAAAIAKLLRPSFMLGEGHWIIRHDTGLSLFQFLTSTLLSLWGIFHYSDMMDACWAWSRWTADKEVRSRELHLLAVKI